jgi:hypothetical protein
VNDRQISPTEGHPEFDIEAWIQVERMAAVGHRVTVEREDQHRHAVRTLVHDRAPMTEDEASCWANAWIDAGRPCDPEPWVFTEIERGVRYDPDAKTLVVPQRDS